MAHHEPAMAVELGPDGRPPRFDGAAWVSQDGKYFWNGAAWQRIKRQRFRPPIAVTVIVVVVVVLAGYVAKSIPQPAPPPYGVTNGKINTSTQFEFDYRRSTTCNNLTFDYMFFDKGGTQVNTFAGQQTNKVLANNNYHFTINLFFGLAIDPKAVRFTANPTCHD